MLKGGSCDISLRICYASEQTDASRPLLEGMERLQEGEHERPGRSEEKLVSASIRERKLVQGVLQGKSVRQAAKEAGYAKSTAEVKSYGILQRPRVQSFLTEALERAGITPEVLAKPVVEALQARVRVPNHQRGTVTETNLPDHQIRLQAYDRVVAAYGAVPKAVEMPEPPPPGLTVNITVKEPKQPQALATSVAASPEERLLHGSPLCLQLQTPPGGASSESS